jgi:hypothetical protein
MKKHFEIVLTYIHIDCFLIFSYEILKFQIFFKKKFRLTYVRPSPKKYQTQATLAWQPCQAQTPWLWQPCLVPDPGTDLAWLLAQVLGFGVFGKVVKAKLIGSGNAITFKALGSNMDVRLETFNAFSILLIYFFTF